MNEPSEQTSDLSLNKFIRIGKRLRKEGSIRFIDRNKDIHTKRVARNVIRLMEDGDFDQSFVISSKIALAGNRDDIERYLNTIAGQSLSDSRINNILSTADLPVLQYHNGHELNQEILKIVKDSFHDTRPPNYTILDIIQIEELIHESHINPIDMIGAPKGAGKLSLLKKLQRIADSNIGKSEEDYKYLKLSGFSKTVNPGVVVAPHKGVIYMETIHIEGEPLIMYLHLGAFMDNQRFIQTLDREVNLGEKVVDELLSTMKREAGVRRAKRPVKIIGTVKRKAIVHKKPGQSPLYYPTETPAKLKGHRRRMVNHSAVSSTT